MVRLGKKVYVLTRDDQLFRYYEEGFNVAPLQSVLSNDGRSSLLVTRQGSDFDIVEFDAVKGGPGRQRINGPFEPPLVSTSSYHSSKRPFLPECGRCCSDGVLGGWGGRGCQAMFPKCTAHVIQDS